MLCVASFLSARFFALMLRFKAFIRSTTFSRRAAG
jgi:hypothetical protein